MQKYVYLAVQKVIVKYQNQTQSTGKVNTLN